MKSLFINAGFMPVIKFKEIPQEYKSEFMQELVRSNLKKEKLLSFVLIAASLILLWTDALATDFWRQEVHVFGRFAEFHVLLLVVPFVFLLLLLAGEKGKVTRIWFYRMAHLVLITFVLSFCAIIAANNTAVNKQLFAYIIAVFCIASLILLTRFETFLFYISSYILYITQVRKANLHLHDLYGNLIFLAMLVILAAVVSNINFSSYVDSFVNRKAILDKNEALRISAEENARLLSETVKYDELKSTFFANVSHELRTPINVILAAIQLSELNLKRDTAVNLDKWSKNSKMMKQNCLRLLRLVNNLIDVTKIDAGFHELHLQPLDLVKLIEEITLSVAEYAKGKGITTQFDTDIEEKNMYADPDQIERIMLNLLSNAIKFTETNGDIFVSIYDKGDSVLISVKDTGIGIAPDKQEMIFERFRQVEQAFTRKYEGSGIGLSLVQSLVHMHGGTIQVISEVNAGSEFIIGLPVKRGEVCECSQVNGHYNSNHVEKMNVEFSDIYMQGHGISPQ